MKQAIKKAALVVACAAGMAATMQVEAANWLMLQGAEKSAAAGRAKVWGFIQPQYQKDFSDAHANGTFVPRKLVGPDLRSQDAFNVFRARVGIRGTGMPLDPKVNYFFLAEFGNNGITAARDSGASITDASITLNHIKGARIRTGLFKFPMAEEIYQGIALFDYINFTLGTNQMLNERFANDDLVGGPVNPQNPELTNVAPNGFDKPVGAGRDVGIQVFDTFKRGSWEHSYSVMMGNGNGLNFTDNDSNKDKYFYWSSEKVFGGKGPRRSGVKVFAWMQKGVRTIDGDVSSTTTNVFVNAGVDTVVGTADDVTKAIVESNGVTNVEYDRKRAGIGVKYLKKPYRITAEYMTADGMIWLGPHKQLFDMNAVGGPGDGREDKAKSWYIEGGWYVPNTPWELDVRYDKYNRLTKGVDMFQLEATNLTLGTQYHFNLKSRLAINYEIRKAKTVGANAALFGHLDTIGNRLAIQLTHIF